MSPGVRRSALALAGLALGGAWIAVIGWLDREADTGRALVVAAPAHGQMLRVGRTRYLDVRAEARGLGAAGCKLTATDHVDTWHRQVDQTAGGSKLEETLGPLRGYGERIVWLDLECQGGPPTAQPRARHVTVNALAAERAEIMRVHLPIASVESWMSKKLGPEIELVVEKQLSGKKIVDNDGGWIKLAKLDAYNVRLSVRDGSGLAVTADLETEIDFHWCPNKVIE